MTTKKTAKKSVTSKKAPKAVKEQLAKLIAESPTTSAPAAPAAPSAPKKGDPVTLTVGEVKKIKRLLSVLGMPTTKPYPTSKMVQKFVDGLSGASVGQLAAREELYTLLPVKLPPAAKSTKSSKSTDKKSSENTATEQKPAKPFEHDPRVLAMFPVGSEIVRVYQPRGQAAIEIVVKVQKDGLYYNGTRYDNLSRLGYEITKRDGLDGPRFFGIRVVPKKVAK